MILNKLTLGNRYVKYLKKIENDIIRDLECSAKSYIQDGEFFFTRKEPDRKIYDSDLGCAPDFGCSLTVGETYSIVTEVDGLLIIILIFKSNLGNDCYNITLAYKLPNDKVAHTTDFKIHAGKIFKFFLKLNELVKKRYKIQIDSF